MNAEELFVNINDLPDVLTKSEFVELFIKFKNGDLVARDKLVHHNIKLIISRVLTRFKTVTCDKKELVSIGCFGLLNALNNFDLTRNVEFSTYAVWCIDRKIIKYLKSLKKFNNIDSLDRVIESNNKPVILLDIIASESNLLEDLIKEERAVIIRNLVNNLPKREQEMVMMYFGFLECGVCKQSDIAQKFNVSQPYVSILIDKALLQISDELMALGIIENVNVKRKKR